MSSKTEQQAKRTSRNDDGSRYLYTFSVRDIFGRSNLVIHVWRTPQAGRYAGTEAWKLLSAEHAGKHNGGFVLAEACMPASWVPPERPDGTVWPQSWPGIECMREQGAECEVCRTLDEMGRGLVGQAETARTTEASDE